MPQKGAACFEPARDIVAAPYSYKQEAIANETYAEFKPEDIPSERLLFFAGSIHLEEPEYSGGVRQVRCMWCCSSRGCLSLISDGRAVSPSIGDFRFIA